jgi:hypothetical protein
MPHCHDRDRDQSSEDPEVTTYRVFGSPTVLLPPRGSYSREDAEVYLAACHPKAYFQPSGVNMPHTKYAMSESEPCARDPVCRYLVHRLWARTAAFIAFVLALALILS